MASKSSTVRIEILGDAKDLKKALGEAEKSTKSFGDNVKKDTQLLGKWALGAVGAVVGIGAAIAGLAIKGGIDRALNIENAQAKLKGLGHDAKSVETIMESALNAVRGTAFGLDEAATMAATAVAAGIQPGQELERYLRLTADAATIAGISMGEMGSIINKTTTSGRVFTAELNQLADRGLPVFTWLQEAYGVSASKLRDMVSAGEIDSARFRQIIEENIGGSALASGDTTTGAFANMRAAMSRFGETLVQDLLPVAKLVFEQVGQGFDRMAGVFKPVMEEFGKSTVLEGFKKGVAGIPDLMERLAEGLLSVWKNTELLRDVIANTFVGAFIILESWLGKTALAVFALHKALTVLKTHPVIAGLGALALAVGTVSQKMKEGLREAESLADGWSELNRAAREMALLELFDPTQLEVLRIAGLTMSDLTDTSVRWKDVLEQVNKVQFDSNTESRLLAAAYELENSTLQELVKAQEPHLEQLQEQTAEYARNRDAGRHRGEVLKTANEAISSSTEDVAEATDEARTALEKFDDEVRGQIDPLFALFKAHKDVERAVNDVRIAREEFGEGSDEYAEDVLGLADANLDLRAALFKVRGESDLTRSDFEAHLRSMGNITDAEIRRILDRLDELNAFQFDPKEIRIHERLPAIGRSPGRARGGPVRSGESYVVGEEGPEVLQMGSQSGTVIPNDRLGGGNTYIINTIQDGNRLVRDLERQTAYLLALEG